MIYTQNLHTHSTYCDGKDTPEEIIKYAIEKGYKSIGFSGHSYMFFMPSISMSIEGTKKYNEEIKALKEKYKNEIEIFHGLEFEMYSDCEKSRYDYVIGASHYFKFGNEYVGFDRDAKTVKNVIDTYFNGDGMKYAKEYYRNLAKLPEYGNFDIVGHFDLVAKHCEKETFFDIESKEYRNYAFEALYALKEKIDVFEINTGAIARGYRTTPYPSHFILKEMNNIGCKIIISSDCHDKNYLTNYFHESVLLMKACGFSEVYTLTKNGFQGNKIR